MKRLKSEVTLGRNFRGYHIMNFKISFFGETRILKKKKLCGADYSRINKNVHEFRDGTITSRKNLQKSLKYEKSTKEYS